MKAIIVSGMAAVGKTAVSRLVANALGIGVIGGGDVLKEMAVEEGYAPGGDDWWDTDEGMKFLQERKKSAGFDREVDSRLLSKAKAGNVVITSYPLPWLATSGIKVWLSGSVDTRSTRMSKRDKIPVESCKDVLSVRDAENCSLYKKIYEIEFGRDLKPFDLIVDTDSIDETKVVEIILHFVKNRRD
jgi:cytidylate kinase